MPKLTEGKPSVKIQAPNNKKQKNYKYQNFKHQTICSALNLVLSTLRFGAYLGFVFLKFGICHSLANT
jgi:hypothetical protein